MTGLYRTLWAKKLSKCRHPKSIAQIHALLLMTGILSSHEHPNAHLIASYADSGDMCSALQLFDEMPQRMTPTWNAMIIAYSRRHSPYESPYSLPPDDY